MTEDSVITTRHRAEALLLVLRPSTWRSSATIDRSRLGWAVPFRVGVAAGLMLLVGGLLDRPDLAGLAALGALISAFSRSDPYPLRARRLVVVGAAMIAAVGLGGILGLTAAPIGIEIAALSLLAGVGATLMMMLHIMGPGAVVFLFAAVAAAGTTTDGQILLTALIAVVVGVITGWIAALLPWLARLPMQHHTGAGAHDDEPRRESVRTSLRTGPSRAVVVNGLRTTVASAVSASLALASGLSHPMWAAMGAVAALQGATFHLTVQRGVQRLVGNVIGGLLAAGLLLLGLDYWVTVAIIVVCQIAAEVLAVINYALCSIAVTPMALLLTSMTVDLDAAAALDRVGDTLIGILVGIAVVAITLTRHDDRPPARLRTTRASHFPPTS